MEFPGVPPTSYLTLRVGHCEGKCFPGNSFSTPRNFRIRIRIRIRSEIGKSSSDVDDEDTNTEVVAEYLNVGRDSRGIRSVSGLEAGPVSRSAVRVCIASTCFLPVYPMVSTLPRLPEVEKSEVFTLH